MSDMKTHLEQQIITAFSPAYFEVVNESHQHSGPQSESHFKLVIVSDAFENVKLIDRHRMINTLFKQELNDIHALAMHTYTPQEWTKRTGAPDSPKCAGGSKS